jgi:hypothetical protein
MKKETPVAKLDMPKKSGRGLGSPPSRSQTKTSNLNRPDPAAMGKTSAEEKRSKTRKKPGRKPGNRVPRVQFHTTVPPELNTELKDQMRADRLNAPQLLAVMLEAYKDLPNDKREALIKKILESWQ